MALLQYYCAPFGFGSSVSEDRGRLVGSTCPKSTYGRWDHDPPYLVQSASNPPVSCLSRTVSRTMLRGLSRSYAQGGITAHRSVPISFRAPSDQRLFSVEQRNAQHQCTRAHWLCPSFDRGTNWLDERDLERICHRSHLPAAPNNATSRRCTLTRSAASSAAITPQFNIEANDW